MGEYPWGRAGRIGFNRRLDVRRLASVLRGFLELVERNDMFRTALRDGFNFLCKHDCSSFGVRGAAAITPCHSREHAGSVVRKGLCGVMLGNEALRFC